MYDNFDYLYGLLRDNNLISSGCSAQPYSASINKFDPSMFKLY